MTDTNTSGDDSAPGAAPSQTAGQAPAASAETGAFGAFQQTGAFGSARGSGLARGKRASLPAASAAPAAKSGGYKPTALEVIIPQREYKNPFTGETAANPPAETPAESPAQAERPAREYITPQPAPAPEPAPRFDPPEMEIPAAAEKFAEETAAGKPELTILPPAQKPQPALKWESEPASDSRPQAPIAPFPPRRDDRPGNRGDSGRGQRFDGRESRPEGREPRQGQRHEGQESRREREPYPDREPSHHEPRADVPQKSGGFFAWLKGLFAGKPAVQPQRGEGERAHDGQHQRRRRRRGGRGRHQGEYRGGYNAERGGSDPAGQGPSAPQEGGQRRYAEGESRGDFHGGDRRRRRGGRGRFRDDRGGPRSEGQQGGGAI